MSKSPWGKSPFQEVLTQAVSDLAEHGYEIDRFLVWIKRLRIAASVKIPPIEVLQNRMQLALTREFRRAISPTSIQRYHPGISRFTIDRIQPHLRVELDRRILASADLIKLNREQAIEKTLQRFSGWATSIPGGGSRVVEKLDVKKHISKPLYSMSFEERRLYIDQGHKLLSSVNAVIGIQSGAIAIKWRSHWRQPGYDYRPDHKERDGKIYAIRGNWAAEKGLMKKGSGYSDEMTQPAEEPFCFPSDTSIQFADDVEIAYRRWYEGELAIITTASGKTIRATLNHPILTTNGWVAAGLLKEGDDVIEISNDSIQSVMSKSNDDRAIPCISQVFDAVHMVGKFSNIRGSGHQFHGDGQEGNVNIVRTARPLSFGLIARPFKSRNKLFFSLSDLRASAFSALDFFFHCCAFFATSFMRSLNACMVLFRSFVLGDKDICLGGVSDGTSRANDCINNARTADAIFAGQGQNAFSRRMSSIKKLAVQRFNFGVSWRNFSKKTVFVQESFRDVAAISNFLNGHSLRTEKGNIVKVQRVNFSGHVFNLQTRDGWYAAEGIITHNCRCFAVYLYNLRDLPPEMLTKKGQAMLEQTRLKGK